MASAPDDLTNHIGVSYAEGWKPAYRICVFGANQFPVNFDRHQSNRLDASKPYRLRDHSNNQEGAMSRDDFVRIIGLPGVINRIYPEEMFVAVQCRKGTGIVTVRAEQVLSEERFLIARWADMGLIKRVAAERDAILKDSAALQVMIERAHITRRRNG